MPRQKEYDKEEVLSKAMKAFWDKGYQATSMQDLVDCMEINRFSIYSTFKNKHELFIEALQSYLDSFIHPLLEELKTSPKGLQAIEDYLNKFTTYMKQGIAPNGCLLINTANELGTSKDVNIKKILRNYLDELEEAYLQALKQAKKLKQIPAEINESEYAKVLVGYTNGLGTIGKIMNDEELKKSIKATMKAIK